MLTTNTRADTTPAPSEDTEVPAVCEPCLGPNPYIRMTRERYGAECKLCARPFTVFRWQPEAGNGAAPAAGHRKPKKTAICLTCARQKNCCQTCMLDLTYGLPLYIRDAALKMVAGGGSATNTTSNASNAIIQQYIARNFEYEHDGSADDLADVERERLMEESEAARNLLTQLATAMPYYKRQLPNNTLTPAQQRQKQEQQQQATSATTKALALSVSKIASKLPLNGTNIPPKDETITSLFVMGVEDDLPEYVLRDYFARHGKIASLVCVHRARCAFVTFADRRGAEAAARSVPTPGGKLVLNGCKLRIAWSKPRPLGSNHGEHTRLGQIIRKAIRQRDLKERSHAKRGQSEDGGAAAGKRDGEEEILAPPTAGGAGQKAKYRTAQSGYEG